MYEMLLWCWSDLISKQNLDPSDFPMSGFYSLARVYDQAWGELYMSFITSVIGFIDYRVWGINRPVVFLNLF